MNPKLRSTVVNEFLKLWTLVMNPSGDMPVRIVSPNTAGRTTQFKCIWRHIVSERREHRMRKRTGAGVFHAVEARNATRMGCCRTTQQMKRSVNRNCNTSNSIAYHGNRITFFIISGG